ncbi:MAG: hybrid sensor histidine kinase/response regulator [Comamonadaceae bacterium]|nr:MAG: hybrid sensor histidine kinase/response regulator [Comamonadaceae bacterium]
MPSVMNKPSSRILLIDDMPSIHEDFRKVLTPNRASAALDEAEGMLFGTATAPREVFELDSASSGEEGLRLLRTANLEGRPYALAFVDMRMPAGWDGVRTIEELWREDADLQVVICTAYSDNPLENALGRLGSQDRLLVLKKPFDPIEVTQMARALVAKRRLACEAASHLAKLERVLREVQEASVELRRRNEELEVVAANVSQNLRSPMRAIGMLSTLLSQELRSHRGDKVAGYLEQLRDGARSGEQLVAGVLSLSDIAGADVVGESVDLTRMARELVAAQRQAHPQQQVSASVQDGLRTWGDSRLVREALGHLLDNAWKFTSRQKAAAITVGANTGAEGEQVFFVRDSGCGFDAARAASLFRKFQRLHDPALYPGGGVGLVSVGRIIERHGGQVWADSRPDQGTTVFFTLPSAVPR